jgi:hypothetical protein
VALGVEGMPAGKVVRKVVLLVLGVALFSASLTAVFLSMRSVMDVGGSCASGGPYPATPCPDGAWLTPVGIFVGLGACALMVAGAFPGAGPQPVAFAWSALFLALGWNFWDYGLNPPDGTSVAVGWIVCGVVFVVMGGLPLVPILRHPRAVLWGGTPPPALPREVRRISPSGSQRAAAKEAPATWRWAPVTTTTTATATSTASAGTMAERRQEHVVSRLERLSELYRRGDLTVEEYQAAKGAVLAHEHDEHQP